MDIVGLGDTTWNDDHIHTVDIWFSQRRGCWVVERLNHNGDLVGAAHCCATLHDAQHCLDHWLRAHDEAFLSTSRHARDAAGAASKKAA